MGRALPVSDRARFLPRRVMLPRLFKGCCTGLGPGFCRAGVQRSEQEQKAEALFLRDRDAAIPRKALSAARQPFAPLLSAPSAPVAAYIVSVQAAAMRYAAPPPTPGDVFPAVPAGGFCPVIEVVFLTVCPVTLRLCVVCVFACDMRVEDDAACVPAGPCLPPRVLTLSDRLRLAGEAGAGVWRVPW